MTGNRVISVGKRAKDEEKPFLNNYCKQDIVWLKAGWEDDYKVRESTHSWRKLLGQLKRMGPSTAAKLALGDGSLRFWVALQEKDGQGAQQRCWLQKTLGPQRSVWKPKNIGLT